MGRMTDFRCKVDIKQQQQQQQQQQGQVPF